MDYVPSATSGLIECKLTTLSLRKLDLNLCFFFFFNHTAPPELSPLPLPAALPISRRDGIVGLLVPPGTAADLGAAKFFRKISTTARPAALFDFETRRTRFGIEQGGGAARRA